MALSARLLAAAALLCLCSAVSARTLKQVGLGAGAIVLRPRGWRPGRRRPPPPLQRGAATRCPAPPQPPAHPPSLPPQDANAKIWANYTLERATFYASVQMKLPAPETATAEACAEACLADERCIFWSWCPASVAAGCPVAGANGTTQSTPKPKTCLLSWDTATDSLAVFAMASGAGCAWEALARAGSGYSLRCTLRAAHTMALARPSPSP